MYRKQKIRFTYNAATPGHGDVSKVTGKTSSRTILPTNWLNGCLLRMFMDEDEHKYFVNRIEGDITLAEDAVVAEEDK
jgi:hypothetical protein